MAVTTSAGGSSRFRQRKLNVKAALPVLRERDIEPDASSTAHATPTPDGIPDTITPHTHAPPPLATAESVNLAGLPKVESGVESKEEREHHLQAIISASHAAALGGKIAQQLFIPTPDAIESSSAAQMYSKLYPSRFAQPATYIRFSSTVEDCTGVPYNMTDEDEAALKTTNTKFRGSAGGSGSNGTCSEDQFEQIISSFEETSSTRQPFAAVDNTPVLSYDELSTAFDETVDDAAKAFAPAIYEYWSARRQASGHHPLVPRLKTLKMDAVAQEADDSDPYVCFRRREVRQVRKTRGRDAQVGEKLKKLRRELEDGRRLLDLVRRRELGRRDELAVGREIFEKRCSVRDMKRALNIEGGEDDDLLLTQRPAKKRALAEVPPPNTAVTSATIPTAKTAQQLRLLRTESSNAAVASQQDADAMVMLRDRLREREQRVAEKMAEQMALLEAMSERFVDRTEEAILGLWSPVEEMENGHHSLPGAGAGGWVSAKVEVTQQPTPPESVVSGGEEEDDEDPVDGDEDGDGDRPMHDADSSSDELEPSHNYHRKHPPKPPQQPLISLRHPSPLESSSLPLRTAPRYRQRHGRNNRLWLDRRFPIDTVAAAALMKKVAVRDQLLGTDRYKYDRESGDEMERDELDVFTTEGFFYREFLRGRAEGRG